jgi:hypothetical protein
LGTRAMWKTLTRCCWDRSCWRVGRWRRRYWDGISFRQNLTVAHRAPRRVEMRIHVVVVVKMMVVEDERRGGGNVDKRA